MMRDIEIGDTLFGYPVTRVTADLIEISIPFGGPQLTFERAQFNEGVRYALALAGSWIANG